MAPGRSRQRLPPAHARPVPRWGLCPVALGHGLVAVTLAALFVVGVRAESVGLLAVAAVGTLQAVPNAVAFFVDDRVRLAAPIALLVAGGVLVGLAVTVVRRRNRRAG